MPPPKTIFPDGMSFCAVELRIIRYRTTFPKLVLISMGLRGSVPVPTKGIPKCVLGQVNDDFFPRAGETGAYTTG